MQIQSAFMGAAAAAVLLVAILLQRRDQTALRLAALTLAFGLWCIARGAAEAGAGWGPAAGELSLIAIGPLALLVAAGLTGRTPSLASRPWLMLLAPITLLAAGVLHGGRSTQIEVLVRLWAIAGVLGGAVVLARFKPAQAESHTPESVRLRYLSIAHAIVVLAIVADTVMWQLGVPAVAASLAPLLYLYAGYLHLARVRVADLRQLIGNAIALTLMAVGLAGLFAAIRIWVGPRLDLFVFNAFVASFALLLGFESVRNRIQAAMDRRFVADRIELERALAPLKERLTRILSLDELLQEMLSSLEKTPQLRSSSVFLRDDASLGFQQAGSIGLPPRTRVSLMRHPIFVAALEQSDALPYADLETARAATRDEAERERLGALCRMLRDLDAHLALPLRANGHLVGFWTLTDARSEESFSTDEVRLLRGIAAQLAASIDKSKTFERIRARDRLATLGEMAAGVAHEIRNPLAAIRGAIAVMGPPGDAADAEFHEMIVEEIQRLDRVVESFLDYARPVSHSSVIDDIGGFVERCARELARTRGRPQVSLQIDAEPGLPALCADPEQLERVLVNVVQNAFEALEGAGNIRISTRRPPGASGNAAGVEITVSDDGPGMDDATLERAFVPFFTTKERGTGMGLALCERLMRAQGGSIGLRSRPGEGTTVSIRLAARSKPEPETA